MLTIFAVTVLLLSPFDGDVPVERLVENGKYTEAETILKQRLQTGLAPADRTKALLELVEVYRQAGRPSLAAPLVEESVRLAMQVDDGIMRGRAHCSLAKGLQLRGRSAEAEQEFHCALKLVPADSVEQVEIRNAFARFLTQEARLAEAEQQLQTALRLLDDTSADPAQLATVLFSYATIRYHQARYRESSQMLLRAEAALSATASGGPLRGEILNLRGAISKAQGELSDAVRIWKECIDFYQRNPQRFRGLESSAEPFLNLSFLLMEQRQFRAGLAAAMDADRWLASGPEPRYFQQGKAKSLVGWAHQGLRNWPQARKFYTEALDSFRLTVNPKSEPAGVVLVNLAGVAFEQRAYAEAAGLLEEARLILEQEGIPNRSRVARLELAAKVARKLGNKAEAASIETQVKTLAATDDLRDRHTVSIQALRQQQ